MRYGKPEAFTVAVFALSLGFACRSVARESPFELLMLPSVFTIGLWPYPRIYCSDVSVPV